MHVSIFTDIIIIYRTHSSNKNRRNYVDDALDNLEEDKDKLKELLELTREKQKQQEERLELLEQDNVQLRKILDEVKFIHAMVPALPFCFPPLPLSLKV